MGQDGAFAPSTFQPTLPVRGATGLDALQVVLPVVSTHAPREGSDCGLIPAYYVMPSFNPRSP